MYLTAFIVFFIAWLVGWGVLQVGGSLMHLLIVTAVAALILHFVTERRAAG